MRYGRLFLMGSFGVQLGQAMATRYSAAITSMNYLVIGWGPLVVAAGAIYVLADIFLSRTSAKKTVRAPV
jgi:hypothetical protein